MSNVIELRPGSKAIADLGTNIEPLAIEFIEMFYDWCLTNGIDVDDPFYKYDAAVIMTTVQGMIQKARV